MRKVAIACSILLTATTLHAAPREPEPRSPEGARFVRAAGRQSDPSVATNGSDFFSVWLDSRGGTAEIYGTAVRSDGTVVSPYGLDVSYPDRECATPRVVWNGESYLVVWRTRSQLRAVSVSPDGKRLGEPRTLLDGAVNDVAISSNGQVTMVAAFAGTHNGTELRLLALDRAGNVIASNRLITAAHLWKLTVAAAGDGFAVVAVSYSDRELLVWRADERGSVAVETPRTLGENVLSYGFRAASTAGKALIVYSSSKPGSTDLLSGFFITNDAISPPFPIALNEGSDVALSADDEGFVVTLPRQTGYERPLFTGDVGPFEHPAFDIDTLRIGLDGHVGSPTRVIRGEFSDEQPAIAVRGGTLFVAWIEHAIRESRWKIAAAITPIDREATEPIAIARSAPRQAFPAVAGGGDDFLFVWQEEPSNDGLSTIQARTRDGAAVSLPVTGLDHFFPSVAFDGTRYLVTWIERRATEFRLVGRFVGTRGNPEGLPFDIGDRHFDPHTHPALASNGDGFVVVYGGTSSLKSARIDTKGAITSFELLLDTSARGHSLRLTAMRDSYLAAWADGRQVLVIQFVPGDPFGFVLNKIHPAVEPYDAPAVVCMASLCAIAGNQPSGRLVTTLLPSHSEFAALPYLHVNEPQLLVANGIFVLLLKDFQNDMLSVWWTDTEDVAPLVERRLIGAYAAASNSAGEIGIAYVAATPRLGGVERVHRTVVRK